MSIILSMLGCRRWGLFHDVFERKCYVKLTMLLWSTYSLTLKLHVVFLMCCHDLEDSHSILSYRVTTRSSISYQWCNHQDLGECIEFHVFQIWYCILPYKCHWYVSVINSYDSWVWHQENSGASSDISDPSLTQQIKWLKWRKAWSFVGGKHLQFFLKFMFCNIDCRLFSLVDNVCLGKLKRKYNDSNSNWRSSSYWQDGYSWFVIASRHVCSHLSHQRYHEKNYSLTTKQHRFWKKDQLDFLITSSWQKHLVSCHKPSHQTGQ